ncbi:endolytic transglycosylase MltG [Methylocucumis oryzae]|uniref:endolytic transglycosylase MltG n=1 Tax=Methylocucumis oryzae TaxID=1632867 RepID=UPI000A8C75BE|nr:endolytic transglycosylase MltG [Methylocucumis oryzae]
MKKGDSFSRITEKLKAQGVITKPFWFKFLAYKDKSFKKIKTGEYELLPGLTLPGLLSLFVLGKTKQHSMTIPEGLNFKQVLQKLEQEPNLKHTLTEQQTSVLMQALGADFKHPEGVFFPDTYYFEKHTEDSAILKRAYQKMQTVLTTAWQTREADLPLATPYDALILASIVEKETAVASERPLIAGLFIQRLKQHMPLQTDPTVIYGMGERYQGNITRTDLTTATPYNTYTFKGLPPTPIAMPGQEAINAVLHPDASDYLYFVAKGDGSHQFF